MGGFANNAPIVTDGLVFYVDAGNSNSYPSSGTTWSDLVGSNDGTLTNSPTFDSGNGGSIVFDGVNDYVATSFTPQGFNEVSVSAWFKTTETNYGVLFSGYSGFDATNSNGFGVTINRGSVIPETDSVHYYGRVGTGQTNDQQCYITSSGLIDGEWHHFVVTHDLPNGTVTMYVDGVSKTVTNTKTTSSGAWGVFEYPPHIGGNNNQGTPNSFLNCSIACFSFYDRVLTSTEVLQNYNALKNRFV